MSGPKRVLTANLEASVFEALTPALGRAEFDFNSVPAIESATELVRLIAFDVILLGCQELDPAIDALLAAVRRPDAPSRSAKILLFAATSRIDIAQTYVHVGADQALSTALPPLELQETILRLLRARPRLSARVMARLTVRLDDEASQFLCQTRDLSSSGMLAVTEKRFPVGTPVRFLLDLPEDREPVRGEAEVVRHAERSRDQVDGLGMRFLVFRPGDERRLAEFLALHGA